MGRVAQLYEEWWKSVGNDSMPQVQVDEMRKAFYSGVSASIFLLSDIADREEDEDKAASIIQESLDECQHYFHTLPPGSKP